jgi:hypothetical protein
MISKVYKGSRSYFTGEGVGNNDSTKIAQDQQEKMMRMAQDSQAKNPQKPEGKGQGDFGSQFSETAQKMIESMTATIFTKLLNPLVWFSAAMNAARKPLVIIDDLAVFGENIASKLKF